MTDKNKDTDYWDDECHHCGGRLIPPDQGEVPDYAIEEVPDLIYEDCLNGVWISS